MRKYFNITRIGTHLYSAILMNKLKLTKIKLEIVATVSLHTITDASALPSLQITSRPWQFVWIVYEKIQTLFSAHLKDFITIISIIITFVWFTNIIFPPVPSLIDIIIGAGHREGRGRIITFQNIIQNILCLVFTGDIRNIR